VVFLKKFATGRFDNAHSEYVRQNDWYLMKNGGRRLFDAIPASQWNELARLPTQRHCWARASLETINARDDAWPLTFGNALAPFVLTRAHPRRLTFVGDRISEPFDVLADSDTVDGLAGAIVRTGLAINLKRIPAGAAIIDALRRGYRGRGFCMIKPRRRGCPYIELDDTWRDPEKHFSKGRRWDFRDKRRKARSIGSVAFDIVTPSSTNLDAYLEEAFVVEGAGWKRATGTAIAVSRYRSAFYSRFAKYAAQEGILRLCFLRIGGKTAAMEYAVECDGRFFTHKIGYDETFAFCTPGNLLRLETIRYAAERGLRSYEFMGMDEPWTYLWTKSVRPMVWLKAYPISVRGLWALTYDKPDVRNQTRTPSRRSKAASSFC
jgi:CelD/BcsL family acetyltransferase involved in cellulose biosynthesis